MIAERFRFENMSATAAQLSSRTELPATRRNNPSGRSGMFGDSLRTSQFFGPRYIPPASLQYYAPLLCAASIQLMLAAQQKTMIIRVTAPSSDVRVNSCVPRKITMGQLSLCSESTIDQLANRLLTCRSKLRRMTVVSPWITPVRTEGDALDTLTDEILRRKLSMTIISRPPVMAWHAEALKFLATRAKATVYTLENLHTKLFHIEGDGFRYAMLGSPNLTHNANVVNHELAVEFIETMSSVSDVAKIIDGFDKYINEMIQSEATTLFNH